MWEILPEFDSQFVQLRPTFSFMASQDSICLDQACGTKPSSKPATLLLIYHYKPRSFLSFLSFINLNVNWKNSAFARSILILAFSERFQIHRVAHGFSMVHKWILRVRFYKRSFHFIGTLVITTETALLTLGKRIKEHQDGWESQAHLLSTRVLI